MMNDKTANYIAFAAIVIAIIWAWMKRKTAATTTTATPAAADLPVSWDAPMTGVYDANPFAYQPPNASALTVNIGNQMASQLSDQYMPMFGFVGIAQGSMYQ